MRIFILLFFFTTLIMPQTTYNVTATVFADNYFEFYLDGVLIKQDILDFRPHNAIKFTFTVQKDTPRQYAILAKDW
jgi:hypothetical protein